jgi:hypothetical protein
MKISIFAADSLPLDHKILANPTDDVGGLTGRPDRFVRQLNFNKKRGKYACLSLNYTASEERQMLYIMSYNQLYQRFTD